MAATGSSASALSGCRSMPIAANAVILMVTSVNHSTNSVLRSCAADTLRMYTATISGAPVNEVPAI